jgi:hypothetical protein
VLSRGLGCLERLERSPVPSGASQSLPSSISILVQLAKQAPRHASRLSFETQPPKASTRVEHHRLGRRSRCWYSRRQGRMNIFGGTAHVVEQCVEADEVRVGKRLARPSRLNAVLCGPPAGAWCEGMDTAIYFSGH